MKKVAYELTKITKPNILLPKQMLMQDSRLVPELIPIGRDVLRSSKCDWLVRERSAYMLSYFAKLRRFTWSLRIRYSLHANFRANKLQANFVTPKCRKLQYFTAVSMRYLTKYACKTFPL